MNLGGPELLIILMMLVGLAVPIWAVIDAAVRPDWAWTAAGQNKVLWVVLPILVGLAGLGWIVAIVYFTAIRPQVVEAERRGPGTYGSPPPPYWPPR